MIEREAEEAGGGRQQRERRAAAGCPSRGGTRRAGSRARLSLRGRRGGRRQPDAPEGDDHGQERDDVHHEAGERPAAQRAARPRSTGPIMRDRLNCSEFSATAFGICGGRHHRRQHRLVGRRRLRLREPGQERDQPGWARRRGGP